MAEATTSPPNEDKNPQAGEAITPEGKKAITSKSPKQEEPATPEQLQKNIAGLEGQVGTLTKQLEQQKILQSQADRKRKVAEITHKKLEEQLEKIRSGEISPDEEIPTGETSVERETRLVARIQIQNLILENPDYQELIKQDITLREVLKNNPFALIGDSLDAEDAVAQLKEKLDERVSSLKQVQPKEEKEEGEGAEFEAGLTQPKEGPLSPSPAAEAITPDEKLEESIKSKIRIT